MLWFPSSAVLVDCARFQVFWVDASFVAAQMVEYNPIGD
jgi:hypothetical protein